MTICSFAPQGDPRDRRGYREASRSHRPSDAGVVAVVGPEQFEARAHAMLCPTSPARLAVDDAEASGDLPDLAHLALHPPLTDSPVAVAAWLAVAMCCDGRIQPVELAVLLKLRLHEHLDMDAEEWEDLLMDQCSLLHRFPHEEMVEALRDRWLPALQSPALRRLTFSAALASCMADQYLCRLEADLLVHLGNAWRTDPDLLASVYPDRGVRVRRGRRPSLPVAYRRHLRRQAERQARSTWWAEVFEVDRSPMVRWVRSAWNWAMGSAKPRRRRYRRRML